MTGYSQLFKRILRYLDIVFIPAVIAYFLRPSHIAAQLNFAGLDKSMIQLALAVLLPARVFFFSGLFPSIIEVVMGRQMNVTGAHIKANARRYWFYYLVLMSIPYLCHFCLYLFFPDSRISLMRVEGFTFIVILALFASYIMKTSYIKPFHAAKRPLNVPAPMAAILSLLYLMNISMINVYSSSRLAGVNTGNIASFAFEFIQILIFVLIAFVYADSYPDICNKLQGGKELILVNPPCGNIIQPLLFPLSSQYPPLFVILKALTPKEYRIREHDQKFWKERYYGENKLVAITCFSANSYEAYNIAKEFKKRGSKVVIGGPHVTYLPREALDYCDSVVVGDAEGVWKDVIRDYETGQLKDIYSENSTDELHSEVHRQLMQSDPTEVRGFIETTRGCKFRCQFCTIPGLAGGKVRRKRIDEIVALLTKVKPRYKRISFLDNNIYNDPAYCKELFAAIKPVRILWTSHCTLDIAKNEELLRMARESGCYELKIGYEILSDSEEEKQGGKFAMSKRYVEYTRRIQEEGIDVKATFIIGWDTDTWVNFFKLWKINFVLRPVSTAVGILTPFPGSKIYEDIIKEDRMRNLNWRQYDGFNVVFQMARMNEYLLSKVYMPLNILYLCTTSKLGQLLSFLFVIAAIVVLVKLKG